MMRSVFGPLLALCLIGTAFATEGLDAQFQQILEQKCSKCHSRERIEQAIRSGADMDEILGKMLRLGAKLDDQERRVMGIFWAKGSDYQPLEPTAAPVEDPLKQYRAVLKSRCSGCHSLEVVEQAMAQGRSINELIEMMRKRGAIITEADKNALVPFWGSPYKEE